MAYIGLSQKKVLLLRQILSSMNFELYHDFSHFLSKHFVGKVQKLSVDARFTCPNRDGTIGLGGCTYCNNRSFHPEYCERRDSVEQQLLKGKQFFSRKYPSMKYLAYFQSYTNTYGSLEQLTEMYEEALSVDDVVGVVIGTRPDCVSNELLDYLSDLSKRSFVLIEYGVESTNDQTLKRINRGHTFQCAKGTIVKTAERNIPVGAHFIMGLPGENREEMIHRADEISQLPLDTIKLHQLQIISGTPMAAEYQKNPETFQLFAPNDYAELMVDFLERLTPTIAVERFTSQSPKELLIAPDWGIKNFEFVERVKRRLRERATYQGRLFRA